MSRGNNAVITLEEKLKVGFPGKINLDHVPGKGCGHRLPQIYNLAASSKYRATSAC